MPHQDDSVEQAQIEAGGDQMAEGADQKTDKKKGKKGKKGKKRAKSKKKKRDKEAEMKEAIKIYEDKELEEME